MIVTKPSALAAALLLCVGAAPATAQTRSAQSRPAPSDANAFARRVCNLYPKASGSITSWRGLGCSWTYVDGKALSHGETLTLTAHRNATPVQIAAYRNAEDGYIDGMAKYGLAEITAFDACGPGTGRKAIITASPDLIMVSGYMVCGAHYISADMKVKPATGVDPSRLFDDLMPLVLPLIGARPQR